MVVCKNCLNVVPETLFCLSCGADILYKPPPPPKPLEPRCFNGVKVSEKGADSRCVGCVRRLLTMAEEDPKSDVDYYICAEKWPEWEGIE